MFVTKLDNKNFGARNCRFTRLLPRVDVFCGIFNLIRMETFNVVKTTN